MPGREADAEAAYRQAVAAGDTVHHMRTTRQRISELFQVALGWRTWAGPAGRTLLSRAAMLAHLWSVESAW